MKRSTGRGGTAFAYIMLLSFAQLLMPGLAQTAPPPTIGGPTQLQPGTMPFTTEQMSCFITAAAESDALETYFELSALLGLASVYGNSSDLMKELMADPDVAELMELPLSTVNANYEAWVNQTMEACRMPEMLDNTGMELTSDQVMSWFNSMKTGDLLTGMDFDMTPTDDDEGLANTDFTSMLVAAGMPPLMRRRLLFWGKYKSWRASVSGAALGFGSGIMALRAGTAAQAVVVAIFAAAAAPASITTAAGLAAFTAVSSLTKKKVDTSATSLVTGYTNDTKMLDAFNGAMAFGSEAHSYLNGNGNPSTTSFTSAKLIRLAVNSAVKGKAREWGTKQALSMVELAWAKANEGNPEVTALLPNLLAKAGAVRRLAAAAADVSRENWKTVALEVVTEAVEEAGMSPADILTDGLAAALEPTPGVESTGELTAEDTIELEPLEDAVGDAEDGNGEDNSAPDDGSAEGGSTPDDSATGNAGEGGTADDVTDDEGGSTADDGNADEGSSTAEGSDADEGGSTADDAAADGDDATEGDEATEGDDATDDEGGSTADDGTVDEPTSTDDDGAVDESTSTVDDSAADSGTTSADSGTSSADDAAESVSTSTTE